jgi:hypothetical protein
MDSLQVQGEQQQQQPRYKVRFGLPLSAPHPQLRLIWIGPVVIIGH